MRELPIGIVGAGRVGTALGVAFGRAGYQVVAVAARSRAATERAAAAFPGVPLVDPASVARASRILLLSVTDDAIFPVTDELAKAGVLSEGQYVVHHSGALGLRPLQSAAKAGATPLAIHPAMTFPGLATDADRLPGVSFAITAPASPATARAAAERLVRDLAGVPVWIAEADRTLYHAALTLGANNLVTVVASAMELLGTVGVEDPERVLAPLLGAALENALRLGDAALTGPVLRADAGTIAAHLSATGARAPEIAEAYRRLALLTEARARRAGLVAPERLDRVIEVLRDGSATASNDR